MKKTERIYIPCEKDKGRKRICIDICKTCKNNINCDSYRKAGNARSEIEVKTKTIPDALAPKMLLHV